MKPIARIRHQTGTTLRLVLLPLMTPRALLRELRQTPVLAQRRATHATLSEVFHDSTDHALHKRNVTLIARHLDGDADPVFEWILRCEAPGAALLKQRKEWFFSCAANIPVGDAMLSFPWADIDSVGSDIQHPMPCFSTVVNRTTWQVRHGDRGHVEVALNIRRTLEADRSIPLSDLELTLLEGDSPLLFDTAWSIAKTLPVLPACAAENDHHLAHSQGSSCAPWAAHPPRLRKSVTLQSAAQMLLTEMLGQCIANLALLHHSDNPEVVHQARVGWRRFKSGVRLFKPVLAIESAPSWEPLAPLQHALGDLRDCDVALTETLPKLQDYYTEGKADRCEDWAQMTQSMERTAQRLRGAVRLALQAPAVGQTMLAILQWLTDLATLSESAGTENTPPPSPHDWALHRLDHLHRRLRTAAQDLGPLEHQHRARILAKRLRHGTEALRVWIPKKVGQRWGEEASRWQTTLGASRDMARASVLAAEAGADPRLVAFLRGVAAVHQLQGAQPKIKKR